MIALALVALVVAALVPLVPVTPIPLAHGAPDAAPRPRRHVPAPWWLPTAVAAVALAVAGCAAASLPNPATGIPVVLGVTAVVLAAATGGTAVVPVIFHLARRHPTTPDETNPPRAELRGGLVIGLLERVAVAASVLTGWPEGIAVVLAVKGLARYPEVRDAHASEYFIIGTFTSVLWALAAGGIGAGLVN